MAVWKVKRDFQIAFLRGRGLRPTDRLADIGCGTLRGGIPIIAYLEPGNYYGFDVREDVLQEAWHELGENELTHKQPVLTRCDDLGLLELDERFDLIWAFSVFMHLTDEALDSVLAFASRQLAPSGAMYANVQVGERPEGQWRGFPVITRALADYRRAAARHRLEMADLGTLESLGHPPGLGAPQVMLMLTRPDGEPGRS
jgi:SAM-dependent methyltransferase